MYTPTLACTATKYQTKKPKLKQPRLLYSKTPTDPVCATLCTLFVQMRCTRNHFQLHPYLIHATCKPLCTKTIPMQRSRNHLTSHNSVWRPKIVAKMVRTRNCRGQSCMPAVKMTARKEAPDATTLTSTKLSRSPISLAAELMLQQLGQQPPDRLGRWVGYKLSKPTIGISSRSLYCLIAWSKAVHRNILLWTGKRV